jgi:hypothetical protein
MDDNRLASSTSWANKQWEKDDFLLPERIDPAQSMEPGEVVVC